MSETVSLGCSAVFNMFILYIITERTLHNNFTIVERVQVRRNLSQVEKKQTKCFSFLDGFACGWRAANFSSQYQT